MNERTFEYNKPYAVSDMETEGEVSTFEAYVICDTLDTEYWFLERKETGGWYLDHTWGHFLLARRK